MHAADTELLEANFDIVETVPSSSTRYAKAVERSEQKETLLALQALTVFPPQPVGSRETCNPAPSDTDEDWLVLGLPGLDAKLIEIGFTQDGSPEFYTGNDAGGFRSWRKGDLNIVITEDPIFYRLFLTATHLAKRFNLLDKADRIALFQAVLYGVDQTNLEV